MPDTLFTLFSTVLLRTEIVTLLLYVGVGHDTESSVMRTGYNVQLVGGAGRSNPFVTYSRNIRLLAASECE